MIQKLQFLFVFIALAGGNSIALGQANAAIDRADKSIQGTWRLAGENKGQKGRVHAWFLEYTFNSGEFRQIGYPPLEQSGRYRITKRKGNKLTLELTNQDGTFGKEDRNLEIVMERRGGKLTIDAKRGFTKTGKVAPKKQTAGVPHLRSVKGQVLSSTQMPAVRLEFDKFKYVGAQDFILYDVARAEQHFFVDADKQGRMKRMYWVQFEGYLPTNSHSYQYKVTKSTRIGGLEFIADAYARNVKTSPGRPDSDGSRARAFLEAKGLRMASDDVMSQRLVHLVDDAKRNELMIIYMEDLSAMGLTASDLAPGASAAARWNDIAKGLLERAVRGMKVSQLTGAN